MDYATWLARVCVWREGRGQSQAARLGIWWVLHNRVGKPGFRPTLIRCILQPEAFTSMTHPGDPNLTKFPDDAPALALDWQAWQEIVAATETPAADPTGGAVYYESVDPAELDALRAREPWFAAEKLLVQIDQVRFYSA